MQELLQAQKNKTQLLEDQLKNQQEAHENVINSQSSDKGSQIQQISELTKQLTDAKVATAQADAKAAAAEKAASTAQTKAGGAAAGSSAPVKKTAPKEDIDDFAF